MKLLKTPSTLVLALVAAAAFSGCSSPRTGALEPTGPNRGINMLGIVKTEPRSFVPPKVSTLTVSTDDMVTRNNVTGDKVSLLWGAVQFTDF